MKNSILTILSLLLIFTQHPIFGKSSTTKLKGDLIIFHAGSLAVPFRDISREFKRLHPEVRVFLESAGSRTCARKISDLNRNCDVMASADYTVINELLIPKYSSWNIKFVSNEMSIAFHKFSRRWKDMNKNTWYRILLDENVVFGRADPNTDPCGYRSVLTIKLAEMFYGQNGLAGKFLEKDRRFIRPKEVDLLALLESQTIDYLFIYRSVARQHGLNFISLPDETNLKTPQKKHIYARAEVRISGKKPGSFITKKGEPMVYGITIPNNSQNPEVALEFVRFVLEEGMGMKIMMQNGQPSVIPSPTKTFEKIPPVLQRFALPFRSLDG
ncbi:extracellular solute-binding protein [Candidatus Riflebacteria bacterium]